MASDEIPTFPDLPEALKIAAKIGRLVPFIGAGVSAIGGCPLWDEFANESLKFFLNLRKIDHSEYQQLIKLPARQKLSIAIGLEDDRIKIGFDEILEPERLNPDSKKKGDEIYSYLSDFSKIFITTNYDNWLRKPIVQTSLVSDKKPASTVKPIERRCLFHPDDFSINDLEENTVIQVHGSVEKRNSMVLTTSDYLKRYSNHQINNKGTIENKYLTFLNLLFSTKNIIFIGYSLSDLEILEYVMQKGLASEKDTPSHDGLEEAPKHYMIMGFYSHQLAIMKSLKKYYQKEFKVELLPFSLDKKGYDQLTDVIEQLSKEIPIGQLLQSQSRCDMKTLLND